MKCPECLQADLQVETRDVIYDYKGLTTTIKNVRMNHCERCGAEYVAPEYFPQWMTQMALFRASINASAVPCLQDYAELKDVIIVDWLDFDPDQLAADVPVETFQRERRQRDGATKAVEISYVSWLALQVYNKRLCQAFGWYKGDHATDVPGYVYVSDWQDFLNDLRKARAIAAEPHWEPPANGVVYPPNRRN